jgi:hypothetical protein
LAVQQGSTGRGRGNARAPFAQGAPVRGDRNDPGRAALLELGWNKDTPPLVHARRALFRLLAEDDDPTYLYELAGSIGWRRRE